MGTNRARRVGRCSPAPWACRRAGWPAWTNSRSRSRIVNAVAPIRICDLGGWTDTWFAQHGKVFNIGVHPGVEVQIKVYPAGALPGRVVLDVENYGDRYAFELGDRPDRHPLLEAAVDEIGLPADISVEISVYSETPAGSSTGTSASMTVALVGSARRAHPRASHSPRAGQRGTSNRDRTPRDPVRHPGPAVRGLRGHQLRRNLLLSSRPGHPALRTRHHQGGTRAPARLGVLGACSCVIGRARPCHRPSRPKRARTLPCSTSCAARPNRHAAPSSPRTSARSDKP